MVELDPHLSSQGPINYYFTEGHKYRDRVSLCRRIYGVSICCVPVVLTALQQIDSRRGVAIERLDDRARKLRTSVNWIRNWEMPFVSIVQCLLWLRYLLDNIGCVFRFLMAHWQYSSRSSTITTYKSTERSQVTPRGHKSRAESLRQAAAPIPLCGSTNFEHVIGMWW